MICNDWTRISTVTISIYLFLTSAAREYRQIAASQRRLTTLSMILGEILYEVVLNSYCFPGVLFCQESVVSCLFILFCMVTNPPPYPGSWIQVKYGVQPDKGKVRHSTDRFLTSGFCMLNLYSCWHLFSRPHSSYYGAKSLKQTGISPSLPILMP